MNDGPFFSQNWYRVANLRPKLRQHVEVQRHRYRGKSWYVLDDRLSGQSHRISRLAFSIITKMDGRKTVEQAWSETTKGTKEQAPTQNELITLLVQLHSVDLLEWDKAPDIDELFDRSKRLERRSVWQNLLNPTAFRLPIWDPDRFLVLSSPAIRWVFGWAGAVLWLTVITLAAFIAIAHWSEIVDDVSDHILLGHNLIILLVSYPLIKAAHEFGHAYAVKAFGGSVHEMGIMFLVFFPVPYVDASAASAFRRKSHRVLVGAAGILVELFLSAIALFVWISVEPGQVKAVSLAIMLVGGVSTILFNGNPLLRYDGYYIFSDLVEIPNLGRQANQYWTYLVNHYFFRVRGKTYPADSRTKLWLLLYAPSSFMYRQIVVLAIALFVASQYLFIGILIGGWAIITSFLFPLTRGLWFVITSRHLQPNRARALLVTFGSIAIASIILFAVPAPLHTLSEGIVWLPETSFVRAGADGFIKREIARSGEFVDVGQALVESHDAILATQIAISREHIAELEARLTIEELRDRAQAQLVNLELSQARTELVDQSARADGLVVRSKSAGVFMLPKLADLPGRYVHKGEILGFVLPSESRLVRATVMQDDIDLVRSHLRSVGVRLAERPYETLPALVQREVPGGLDELPSKALGGVGGGALAVDPRDPKGTKTLQRLFQIDLQISSDARAPSNFGGRAYIRFEHAWEPLGRQLWRRISQLLLSRLQY